MSGRPHPFGDRQTAHRRSRWEIDHDRIRFQPAKGVEAMDWIYGYDPRVCWLEDRYSVTWCNAYAGYPTIGVAYTHPPGYKENGSIFCHTNPWIVIAETMLGRGDRAHDYYLRINPSARESISDVHRCEPYVYAQTIAGRDAPTHGEAKNAWLTGTAAWNYVAVTQWILGIRPTYEGLRIAPAIPSHWSVFKAARAFRGVTYRISVERHGEGNDVSLTVDGQRVPGKVAPLPPEGVTEVTVEASVG